jgi:hypothetical protein
MAPQRPGKAREQSFDFLTGALGQDGRPRVPCASQQWKRGNHAGAPLPEALFVLTVLTALRRRLMSARDLIIDSVPILAWRRADPDAAFGHAPAQHPHPLSTSAIASIRSSVVAPACLSFSFFFLPMSMMLLLPNRS